MGEIIGWGNHHGAQEQENWSEDSTPLDSIAGGENDPLLDEETADTVIYEVIDEEDDTQCVQICTSNCADKEAGSMVLKPRSEISPEPPLHNTLVSASGSARRTDQICKSIRELKPVTHGIGFDSYCDITSASLNNIRALIEISNAYDLDYFRIMQAIQDVVKQQANEAEWVRKSPNLNELISFVSSCAQTNRRQRS